MSSGKLFVCAVPIGNLSDASPRLVEVLSTVEVIACEDTRNTRKLLTLLNIEASPRLIAHHEHNEREGAKGVVALLAAGSDVALVSDAGTPAIADPGTFLVTEAHEAGIEVVAVPGPSAVSAALSISGLSGDGYRFVGFLPRKESELVELLDRFRGDLVVGFDSPHRILQSVKTVAAHQPDRVVSLCRELTKRYEEVMIDRAKALDERLAVGERTQGEFVMILAPITNVSDSTSGGDQLSEALKLARVLLAEGLKPRRASAVAAKTFSLAARDIYEMLRDS